MFVNSKVLDLDGCSLDTRICDEKCSSVVDVCGLVVPAKMWWFLAVYLPQGAPTGLSKQRLSRVERLGSRSHSHRQQFCLRFCSVNSSMFVSEVLVYCRSDCVRLVHTTLGEGNHFPSESVVLTFLKNVFAPILGLWSVSWLFLTSHRVLVVMSERFCCCCYSAGLVTRFFGGHEPCCELDGHGLILVLLAIFRLLAGT